MGRKGASKRPPTASQPVSPTSDGAHAAATDASSSKCSKRILDHSAYLDKLISMVPPKYYFAPDPEEMSKKFQKHVNKAAQVPKGQRKLEAKERKKSRLNTTAQLTVTEQQQQLVQQEEAEREAAATDEPLEFASAGDANALTNATLASSRPMERLSVSELRGRLADRLVQLRASRGGNAELRASAPKPGAAKPREKPKHNPRAQVATPSASAPSPAPATAGASKKGAIEFNKLAVAPSAKGTHTQKRKMGTAELLAAAEEKQRKQRARLSEADGGGDDARIEEWQRAIEKAGGIKQKDDPKLLKKSLKRKERQKTRSTKEWKARIKTQLSSQAEAQEKRKTNLAQRMTKSKARAARAREAANNAQSQGRRAGFEGKKSQLLN